MFLAVVALLFVISATTTVTACVSMSAKRAMWCSAGSEMSLAWMRLPGQSVPGAATASLGMWMTMMVAMMLPALAPMLWRYRLRVRGMSESRREWLIVVVGAGYFAVWALVGVGAVGVGFALAELERAMPAMTLARLPVQALVVLGALALHFSAWRSRHLARCHGERLNRSAFTASAAAAWRHGLRHGVHCCCACAGLTAVMLLMGMMDLRVMAGGMAVIGVPRLWWTRAGAERLLRLDRLVDLDACQEGCAAATPDSELVRRNAGIHGVHAPS